MFYLVFLLWKTLKDKYININVLTDTNKTSLTLPLVIEVPVPSPESEWSYIYVKNIDFGSVSTINRLEFENFQTLLVFFIIL